MTPYEVAVTTVLALGGLALGWTLASIARSLRILVDRSNVTISPITRGPSRLDPVPEAVRQAWTDRTALAVGLPSEGDESPNASVSAGPPEPFRTAENVRATWEGPRLPNGDPASTCIVCGHRIGLSLERDAWGHVGPARAHPAQAPEAVAVIRTVDDPLDSDGS